VHIAVQEAEIILFMTDVTTGITDLDAEMAQVLRKSKKPVFLLVNKVDNHERLMLANEFWALGFDNTFFLSSITGSGTGEVLDEVVAKLPDEPEEDPTALPRFAVVGQPNVGKSSFINALMDEDRNIVTDIAGTTRDAIHTRYTKFGKDFILVDTAGLRRKARVHENLEFYSVMRTLKALEECDVCMLLIDAQTGVEAQDMAIFRLAQRRHKGIVLLINKWDLVEKETNTARDMEKEIKLKISPFSDVPVLFMSAMDKTRIFKAMELALEVNENRQRRIKTSELNDTMLEIIERNPPPAYRGNYIKIKYITQLPLAYPAFVFFANHPKEIKEAYRLFLENKLREHFQFTGAPMALMFRQK
jgi:GTP-binding protein